MSSSYRRSVQCAQLSRSHNVVITVSLPSSWLSHRERSTAKMVFNANLTFSRPGNEKFQFGKSNSWIALWQHKQKSNLLVQNNKMFEFRRIKINGNRIKHCARYSSLCVSVYTNKYIDVNNQQRKRNEKVYTASHNTEPLIFISWFNHFSFLQYFAIKSTSWHFNESMCSCCVCLWDSRRTTYKLIECIQTLRQLCECVFEN